MTLFCLLLTPVWAILLLTDRTARRPYRGIGAVILIAYAIYFIPLLATLFGAAGSASLTGPATIQFGDYNQETSGKATIVNPHSVFNSNQKVAYYVALKAAVNTTQIKLSTSRLSLSGGELDVAFLPMNVANPASNIFWSPSPFPVTSITKGQTGNFRMRLYAGDTVIATGDFSVS